MHLRHQAPAECGASAAQAPQRVAAHDAHTAFSFPSCSILFNYTILRDTKVRLGWVWCLIRLNLLLQGSSIGHSACPEPLYLHLPHFRCQPSIAVPPLPAWQDVLVVTAPGSGAEIIPFLKTWVNLPMAIGFTVLYTKAS